jgi:long-chain acyl-CoA synthetase
MSVHEATAVLTAPGAPFEIVEEDGSRVYRNTPPSLRAILESSRVHGDADFIVYEDDRWTFDRHFATVAALARWLRSEGIGKGDRVALAMRNLPEWSVVFWAATAIGAIVVPLNAWWTGRELAYGLADSGASILFADDERAARVDFERTITGLPGDLDAGPQEIPPAELGPHNDATIFYTSGTTGEPKGALGTHRNICTNLMNLALVGARAALRAGADPAPAPRRAALLSVPFFHATGCHSTLVPSLAFGSKLVLMRRFDPERALELIERERCTSFGGVPTIVARILASPDLARRDLSSVTNIGYGGQAAPPELVRRVKQLFPHVTSGTGYGLTETSSLTTSNSGDDYVRKPDSVGPPMPVIDVRIAGDAELGELWIRGPNVVRGYWNKPDDTATTFTDGWLHSGDVARIDGEGFVYIVDRIKDIVIRGGENVYCVEVESALAEHPDVIEAAVFGLPHPDLGEEVAAVVAVRNDASVDENALREHVAERLAAFKVPVRIDVRTQPLPHNAAGKTLKRQLRDELVAARS